MLNLFKNSGMLLLIIVSFVLTHMERDNVSNMLPEEKRMIPLATDSTVEQRGDLVYVATSTPETTQPYGKFTDQIEQILSVTPDDSEIYIEEREGGKWYLKIEKLFSAEEGVASETLPTPQVEMSPPASSPIDDTPLFVPQSHDEETLLV